MANNTSLNGVSIAGGSVIRDIEKNGVKTQVVTLDLGGAGAENLINGSLPVSGPLTDEQLRAAPLSLSTDGLTNTQLRSQAVSVTGPLTDAQLRATPLPITLFDGVRAVEITSSNELVVTTKDQVPSAMVITAQDVASVSTVGANNQTVVTGTPTAGSAAMLTLSGESSFAVQISGTWTGTLQFERSLDSGATFTAVGAFAAGTPFIGSTATTNGAFHGNGSSATNLRVRSIGAFTGSASVKILAGAGTGTITIGNPLRLFDAVTGLQASIKAASALPAATDNAINTLIADQRSANLAVSATGVVNTAVTATLPAAGAGLFHYITSIQVNKLYAVAGTASAAGVIINSTNLPGSLAWTTEQIASAIGTAPRVIDYSPPTPLKSSAANVATTIVAPAQAQTIWRINVTYFTGP